MRSKNLAPLAVTFALVFSAGLVTAPAATACKSGKMALPASVAPEGSLASFLQTTHHMTQRERKAFVQAMPEAEREQMRAEFRALSAEDRKTLSQDLRRESKKKKG